LEYDPSARFRTSLAENGTTSWSQLPIQISHPEANRVAAKSNVSFSNVDWQALQSVYGWAALQWQAWARGEFTVKSEESVLVRVYTPRILEFWIDDEHYFGGDLYAFHRAPVTVRLAPGSHRIDVRLARDTRAMGAVGIPDFELELILEQLIGDAQVWIDPNAPALISDYIGSAEIAILASPYVSVTVHNSLNQEILINAVKSSHTECTVRLVSDEAISIVAGQSRPVAIYFDCGAGHKSEILFSIKYHIAGKDDDLSITFEARPKLQVYGEPHKVTYMHPGGIVSYAVLRPPSPVAIRSVSKGTLLPILVALHGAGVDTDGHDMKHSFDTLPDLKAWALFPSGATPWCGDDWHVWGAADVQAAVQMIPNWIERFKWTTIGVDVDRWLLTGHSNGGQGVWYLLTHHPDKIIAAAPLSGYTSIQNYVPYTFWKPADTGRTAVVQAALNSYKNELLLPNIQGIPILQQHGSSDDNVPPYHSRLMSQLIYEAGAESIYHEFPGKPHYWDGVYTTPQLAAFFDNFLEHNASSIPFRLNSFSVVCVTPGDTSSKFGLEITQLLVPGQLARIEVNFDPLTKTCVLEIHNVRQFYMPVRQLNCCCIYTTLELTEHLCRTTFSNVNSSDSIVKLLTSPPLNVKTIDSSTTSPSLLLPMAVAHGPFPLAKSLNSAPWTPSYTPTAPSPSSDTHPTPSSNISRSKSPATCINTSPPTVSSPHPGTTPSPARPPPPSASPSAPTSRPATIPNSPSGSARTAQRFKSATSASTGCPPSRHTSTLPAMGSRPCFCARFPRGDWSWWCGAQTRRVWPSRRGWCRC
jgi:predicted esterase